MVKISDEQWLELKNPHELFKPFVPKDNDDLVFFGKVGKFKRYLLEKFLYMSDDTRTPEMVDAIMLSYMRGSALNILYEIGDFSGLIGLVEILPGYKCSLLFKLWNNRVWTHTLVKETKNLLDLYIKYFKLKRISTSSADPKVVRMAEMAGFIQEGVLKNDFLWKGKFYDNVLLGLYPIKERKRIELLKKEETDELLHGK